MKLSKLRLEEGRCIPKGYGYCFYDWEMDYVICYLFPFNHIIRCFRKLWYLIRDVKESDEIKKHVAKIIEYKHKLEFDKQKWRHEQINLIKRYRYGDTESKRGSNT